MILCINCVHCRVPYTYHPNADIGWGWEEKHYDRAVCMLTQDYVTGGNENQRLCSDERNDESGCGPLAMNFQAKPPPPPRPPKPPRVSLWKRLFG